MACHGVGPGCTVMGADNVCGGMWKAWAEPPLWVSLPWCDGGIPLDGKEEVVAVRQ